jgi:lysyl endopeptidase
MKKIAFSILLLSCFSSGYTQIQGDGGFVLHEKSLFSPTEIQEINFSKPDIKQLRAEDAVNDEKGNGPWRFGFNHETNLSTENSGAWKSLSNGGKLWLLAINCPQAQTINLTFENTSIPEGNELYVYDASKTFILGKFTQKHLYEGQLGTELIPGEKIIVEYYVAPENNNHQGQVTISTVTHGYRVAEEFQQKAFGQAGACNMNVNCPDGAEFSDQKRSVVMLVSGSNGFCTGALINNTEYDGKPYVLTANHCYTSNSNPASWVFRFNWESSNCTNPGTSPAFSSLSGAVLRARRSASDMCLVEITGGLESGTIPTAYNAYFSGWDRTGENPDWTFGIHHPRGDIKKISFDDNPSLPTQSKIGVVTSELNGVWRVVWDRSTTTEQASSGSPLFDHNRRIIGQLWGGAASCSNLTGPDYYGRVFMSWNPSGSNSTNQLEAWLDPSGTGAIIVDGYEPGLLVSNDGALILPKEAKGTLCSETVTPKFTLVNTGQTSLTSAIISYGFDGSETETYNWTGNLSFLQFEEITLPTATIGGGSHTFSATITSVNGGSDAEDDNNKVLSSFFVMETPEIVDLNLTLDRFASENTWELKNSNDIVVYKSPYYVNADKGLHNYEFCLSEDCYTFTIYDSWGDGMHDSLIGHFQITNSMGEVLTEMTVAESETTSFSSLTRTFCLGNASLESLQNQFSIYPNPSSGTIYWSTDEVNSVTVFDLSGKNLLQKSIDLHVKQLNISQLPNGVYLVGFESNNGTSIQKRIILMQ